ncbi:PTS system, glucose-specific IIA component [Evansella caseinilytica]|uniref:PTS system, glucose-specific IIA component n=1 Tax=Evansella caseinilytica TaxID=1503961 RepID=A0A1H3U4E1_9BACI|nr:PTS glucose transporter subunit IIA [Evansella caseinilytica]SDZ57333.1 PTS system, glucose-specific IIA component [Evansella caseinilytica]
MLKGLFQKKKNSQIEEVLSPMRGKVIPVTEVPDPVFAQRMMGDGIAIIPKSEKVVSPVNGRVIQVFPTKHAIGIQSEHGLELLIHIGLETVELKGEGFEVFVEEDQRVKAGDHLANVDLAYLKRNNKQVVTPMIITNMEKVSNVEASNQKEASWGDVLLHCSLK